MRTANGAHEEQAETGQRYLSYGAIIGFGFMCLTLISGGPEMATPIFIMLSVMAFISVSALSAGVFKYPSMMIGAWLGSIQAYLLAFVYLVFVQFKFIPEVIPI